MDIFFAQAPSGVMFLNEGATITSHDLSLLGIIIKLKYGVRKF